MDDDELRADEDAAPSPSKLPAHKFERLDPRGSGQEIRVTHERIRQLQNIALSTLRRALRKKERPVDVELRLAGSEIKLQRLFAGT